MKDLLKVLSFAVDIAKGLGKLITMLQKEDRKKKDEKEQAEIEELIDSNNNCK